MSTPDTEPQPDMWDWYQAPNWFGAEWLDRKIPNTEGDYRAYWQARNRYEKTGNTDYLDAMKAEVTATVPPRRQEAAALGIVFDAPPEPIAPRDHRTLKRAALVTAVIIPLTLIPALLAVTVGLGPAVLAFIILALVEGVALLTDGKNLDTRRF